MRLRPLQIVGLVAVVLFGGRLVWQLTQPKPDPFHVPGAIPLSVPGTPDAFAPATPDTTTSSTASATSPAPAGVAADLLAVGSDDAKDDLYCSGLIFAAHRANADTLTAEAQTRRDQVIALASAGVEKLVAANAVAATETAAIADAHSAKAAEDFTAGTPRITLDACHHRAEAIPQAKAALPIPAEPVPETAP